MHQLPANVTANCRLFDCFRYMDLDIQWLSEDWSEIALAAGKLLHHFLCSQLYNALLMAC